MSPLLKKRGAADDRVRLRKYCIVSGLLAAAVMLFTYFCHANTLTFGEKDRKSTRLNSSHIQKSRMPSSA